MTGGDESGYNDNNKDIMRMRDNKTRVRIKNKHNTKNEIDNTVRFIF